MAEMVELAAYPLMFGPTREADPSAAQARDDARLISSYGRSIFRRWFIKASATTLASLGASVGLVGLILGA